MKIDTCKFEDNFFDDTLIIVDCTLNHEMKNQYQIKTMMNNDCIKYSFIDINIAHKICESLRINLLKLNKFREVKKYDEWRNKNIIHVIYLFMTIQDHTKNFISMMIIKLNQHSIILKKSWMKKHEISYHEYDDLISFHSEHCNHLKSTKNSFSQRTKKNFSFRKKSYLINQKYKFKTLKTKKY